MHLKERKKIWFGANWVLNVIFIAALVWLFWLSSKKTEQENYSKGANKTETSVVVNEFPLSFGCARNDLRNSGLLPERRKKE